MGKFILGDCMDKENGLPSFPDNHFDLAIVDPPYRDTNQPTKSMRAKNGNMRNWHPAPKSEYFKELFRVSKNQIVWGGNYFIDLWKSPCKGFIFWYKQNPMDNYSDGELAWTSFDVVAKCFYYRYYGNHDGNTINSNKIHPTQKPVNLYKWILNKYANEGDLILDTHVGSASSLIAFESLGFNYLGFEIDPDYYEAAKNRMSKGIQISLL